MNKHLYIGQNVDGYQVVTMNSTYTGGLMISPLINPQPSYDENYTETLDTLDNYNSGGSVVINSEGGTATTPFTDWRLPTRAEWISMLGYNRLTLLPLNQSVWTSTDGILDPSNNKFVVSRSGAGVYTTNVEYDKTSDFAVKFVRAFTL
jgi:hypothetical protein